MRPKTTGVAGTCKHEIIILVSSVSAHLLNATDVTHFFYNALALSALPVPLLRQVCVIPVSDQLLLGMCAQVVSMGSE